MAQVEWTKRAEYIANKEYRYLSRWYWLKRQTSTHGVPTARR